MNTYAIHYAPALARAGKSVEHGMWDRRAAAMGHHYGFVGNPAACRNRANLIEYTTDPARVTCLKCATPAL